MEYLPTKKFLFTAFFIVALFVVWYLFFVRSSSSNNNLLLANTQNATSTSFDISSDIPTNEDLRREYLKLGTEIGTGDIYGSGTKESSDDLLRSYGSEIVAALSPITTLARRNEPEMMLSALKKGTEEKAATELSELNKSASAYKKSEEELLTIVVPPEASDAHIFLVNRISNMANLIQNMTEVISNPVLAVASGNAYTDESSKLFLAIQKINKVFEDRGIVFNESEKATLVIYEAN